MSLLAAPLTLNQKNELILCFFQQTILVFSFEKKRSEPSAVADGLTQVIYQFNFNHLLRHSEPANIYKMIQSIYLSSRAKLF